MKKSLIIKLLIAFSILVVIIIGSIVLVINTIDKDDIAEIVQEKYDRKLNINGNLQLSYYPWLGLTAEDISLSNAKGFGQQPFITAKSINMRMKLLPLLRKKLELDTVVIHGFTLELIRDKNGNTNWQDFITTQPAEKSEPKPSTTSYTLPITGLIISGVDIQNTTISWTDHKNDTHYEINNGSLNMGKLKLNQPIAVTAKLNTSSKRPKINKTITLNSTVTYQNDKILIKPMQLDAVVNGKNIPKNNNQISLLASIAIDFAKESIVIDEFKLSVFDLKLDSTATVTELSGMPKLQSTLNIQTQDLSTLLNILEIQPLAKQFNQIKNKSVNVDMSFSFDSNRRDLDVPKLKMNVLGAEIDVSLTANNIASKQATYQGQVNAKGDDLAIILKTVSQLKGQKQSKLLDQALKKTSKSFDINTEFDVNLRTGVINIPKLNLSALGTQVQAKFGSDDTVIKSKVTGEWKVNGDLAILTQIASALQTDNQLFSDYAKRIAALKNKNFSIDGYMELALKQDSLNINQLKLNVLGINSEITLKATNISSEPKISGQLKVTAGNVSTLINQLADVSFANSKAMNKVSMDSDFSTSLTDLNLNKFNLTIDQTNVTGNIKFKSFSPTDMDVKLDINKINLADYQPKAKKSKAKKPTKQPSSDEQNDFAMLQNLKVNFALTIAELLYQKTQMNNVVMVMSIDQGLLTIDPLSFDLYEGKQQTKFSLDASQDNSKIKLETAVKQVNAGSFFSSFNQAWLTGISNINLNLSSSGKNTDAMIKAMSGMGSFNFKDGSFQGINIDGLLKQIETMIKNKRINKLNIGNQSKFDDINMNVMIDKGVIRNDDLLIKANKFKVSGSGVLLNLNDNSWQYKLNVQADENSYKLGGYALPINCVGQITDFNCKPEIATIVSSLIKKQSVDRVKNLVKDKLNLDVLKGTSPKNQEEETPTDAKEGLKEKATKNVKDLKKLLKF